MSDKKFTHSCLGSIFNLPSYLKNGIVSKMYAAKYGIETNSIFKYSNNSEFQLCLTEHNTKLQKNLSKSSKFYNDYAFSFVINENAISDNDKDYNLMKKQESFGRNVFNDEFFYTENCGFISPDYIDGIIIPEEMANLQISKFPIGLNMPDMKKLNYRSICDNVVSSARDQFNYVGDHSNIEHLLHLLERTNSKDLQFINSCDFITLDSLAETYMQFIESLPPGKDTFRNFTEESINLNFTVERCIRAELESELASYTEEAFKKELDTDSVTVLDAINYYQELSGTDLPIYNTDFDLIESNQEIDRAI